MHGTVGQTDGDLHLMRSLGRVA